MRLALPPGPDCETVPAPFRWIQVEIQGSAGRLGRPNHVTIAPVGGDGSRDPAAVRRLVTSLVASSVLCLAVLGTLLTFYD